MSVYMYVYAEDTDLRSGQQFSLFSATRNTWLQMMLSLMKCVNQKIPFYLKWFPSSLENTNHWCCDINRIVPVLCP